MIRWQWKIIGKYTCFGSKFSSSVLHWNLCGTCGNMYFLCSCNREFLCMDTSGHQFKTTCVTTSAISRFCFTLMLILGFFCTKLGIFLVGNDWCMWPQGSRGVKDSWYSSSLRGVLYQSGIFKQSYWDIGHIFWDIGILSLWKWDIGISMRNLGYSPWGIWDIGLLKIMWDIGILILWIWDIGPLKLGYLRYQDPL